jgi:hypothetical protein
MSKLILTFTAHFAVEYRLFKIKSKKFLNVFKSFFPTSSLFFNQILRTSQQR